MVRKADISEFDHAGLEWLGRRALVVLLGLGALHMLVFTNAQSMHPVSLIMFTYCLILLWPGVDKGKRFRTASLVFGLFFLQLFLERSLPIWPSVLDGIASQMLNKVTGAPAPYSSETAVGQALLLLSILSTHRFAQLAATALMPLLVTFAFFVPLEVFGVFDWSAEFSIFTAAAFFLTGFLQLLRLEACPPFRPFLSRSRHGRLARLVLLASLVLPWIFGLMLLHISMSHAGDPLIFEILGMSILLSALFLINARLVEKLWGELAHAATHDHLTGLLDRRGIAEVIDAPLPPQLRTGVILIDLDHFKTINDSHGHAVGDMVLREAGARITTLNARYGSRAARWGGEEFLIVLRCIEFAELEHLCQAIRDSLAEIALPQKEAAPHTVLVSCGLSEATPEDDGLEPAIQRADVALYEAKETGRDRAVTNRPDFDFPDRKLGRLGQLRAVAGAKAASAKAAAINSRV